MNIEQAFASNYLKAADLQGRSFNLQIARIIVEDVGMDDKPERKPVIHFANAQKGLVLNRTNADAIQTVLGSETDAWIGHTLELFPQRVPFQSRMVDAIRVRVVLPQTAARATMQTPTGPIPTPHPVNQLPVGGPVLGGNAMPAAGIERTLGAQGLDGDDIPF